MIHYVLLKLQGVIVAATARMPVLLQRNLLELLLTASETFVRLLAVLALLKFLPNRFLVRVALHVVMQRTHGELWATHESVLMVSDDWLGARVLLLGLRLLPQHRGRIPTRGLLLLHLTVESFSLFEYLHKLVVHLIAVELLQDLLLVFELVLRLAGLLRLLLLLYECVGVLCLVGSRVPGL